MHRQRTIERYRTARSHPHRAVLEGFHPIKHALRFDTEITEVLSPAPREVLRLADRLAPGVRGPLERALRRVPRDLYDELTPRPPATDAVALAPRPAITATDVLSADGPALALEAPSHLGNVGAAVRVAAAAGAAGVVTTGEHDPWHASALRGSAGLHFALPVARARLGGEDPDPVDPPSVGSLPTHGRPLVAVDPAGEPWGDRPRPRGALLAFGTERRGLRDATLEAADLRVRIPMREGISSLNLATSVAALLYGWSPSAASDRA